MIYQVLSDGVVPIHGKSNFELCANAIHARNQHRLLIAARVEREQSAKATYFSKHLAAMCRSQQLRQRGLDLVSKINIHTRFGIRFHHHRPRPSSSSLVFVLVLVLEAALS